MQLHVCFLFSDPAKKPPAALECLTFNDKRWIWGGPDAPVGDPLQIHSGRAESPEDCLSLCKSYDKEMFTWITPQYHSDSYRKRCLCKMKDGGELNDREGQITGEVSCTGKFYSINLYN